MTAAAEHPAPILDRAIKDRTSATKVLEEPFGIEARRPGPGRSGAVPAPATRSRLGELDLPSR
jgi:hypothetical protein